MSTKTKSSLPAVWGGVAALALVLSLGCVPGSGTVEQRTRDGALPPDGKQLTLLDGSGSKKDRGYVPPQPDNGLPQPDNGLPQPDSYKPPSPDQGPTGPQPPFGTQVGMTAANYSGIPDCNGTQHDLHSKFNKQPAIVLLLNKSS